MSISRTKLRWVERPSILNETEDLRNLNSFTPFPKLGTQILGIKNFPYPGSHEGKTFLNYARKNICSSFCSSIWVTTCKIGLIQDDLK